MKLSALHEGSLLGRIALLRIEDARPSLAYKLQIPVQFKGGKAMLTVDLRHPEVRTWRGLAGRSYVFDESTRRYGKSDGQTYPIDDVFGDLRTPTEQYDTFITVVQFGVGASA